VIEKQLKRFVFVLELIVSIALIVVAILLVISLGYSLLHAVTDDLVFGRAEFTALISSVLEVFIVIELFRVALAYLTHRNVVPIVLEAALVAIARKLIVFEPQGDYLMSALGLASLLLAVGLSWWLLSKANACEPYQNSKH